MKVTVEQKGTSGTPSIEFTWENCLKWGLKVRPKHGDVVELII